MLASLVRRSCAKGSHLPPVAWTYLPSHLPYNLGLLLQETLVARRLHAKSVLKSPELSSTQEELARRTAETDVLLLLQHKPVFTTGRREKDPEQLRLEGERLGKLGADYVSTMRGGQTTYHGPGQLTGYSIMDTAKANLDTRCYVHHLETFLESLATSLGAPVHPCEHTGVFTSPTRKLGSIGIHIRRRITLHGFAINITDEPLWWFDQVVACGLTDVRATSIEREGKAVSGVEGVLDTVLVEFGKEFDRKMVRLEDGDVHEELRAVIAKGVAGTLDPLGTPISL